MCRQEEETLTLLDNSSVIFRPREGKLCPLLRGAWSGLADRCWIQSEMPFSARRFAGQMMTHGWAWHALRPSPLIPLRPAHSTTGCRSEISWGGGARLVHLYVIGLALVAMIKQTKNKNVSWVSEACWWSFLVYSWTTYSSMRGFYYLCCALFKTSGTHAHFCMSID